MARISGTDNRERCWQAEIEASEDLGRFTSTRLVLDMDQIDVDDIAEVNYLDDRSETVEVKFRDGRIERYNGSENPEVFEILNHWTPPTA